MDSRQYTAEALDSDGVSLMIALLTMMRAHEESAVKSGRAKEAFRASVEQARKGAGLVAQKFPSWLRRDVGGTRYEVIPTRATVVQRMLVEELRSQAAPCPHHWAGGSDQPGGR